MGNFNYSKDDVTLSSHVLSFHKVERCKRVFAYPSPSYSMRFSPKILGGYDFISAIKPASKLTRHRQEPKVRKGQSGLLTNDHKRTNNLFSSSRCCSSLHHLTKTFLLKYFPCFDGNWEEHEEPKKSHFSWSQPRTNYTANRLGRHFSCRSEPMCYQETFRIQGSMLKGEQKKTQLRFFLYDKW